METVLVKALSFILIILCAYALKRAGIFCKEDNRIVMKLILNVTLPAAVVAGFSDYTRDLSLVLAAFLGFGLNIVMMFAGYLAAFRKSREEQTFNIVNYSGYNIGTFAMPYLQSFLGNAGTIVACIFDAGNALMCTGLTYAFAAGVCGKQVERGPGAFAARLFASVPFDAYGIMLVLYVLFRSHLTEKRSYDLHRRFAEIFCALGLCMALAVLLAYGKAWLAEGHIGGVLYLSYRNFAASVLLTALPMPFYLSLRHRGHLATAAVLALALALTGSRSALLFGGILLTLCCVYLMRSGVISRRCLVLLAAAAGIGILALGPALLECVLHSRVGEDIQDSNSDRLQFLARAADDFLRHPVFGIGLCSTRNADVFTGVEGSMVFYHNSLAQVMGSMGLVGIVAYGRLLHDRIALLRQGSRDPFVRILTLSYLGMFLISLCNPGEFCPFPNAALMVMVFAQAEEAVGDVSVPVRQLLARHLGAPAGFLQF